MSKEKGIVSIVGGGLAGLAAALHLYERTKDHPESAPEIHIFETSAQLGGRASSHFRTENRLLLDSAQHITMNCCPAMLEFLDQTGLKTFWTKQTEMTFCVRRPMEVQPTRNSSPALNFFEFRNSAWLPKPFHLLPSLWGLKFLTRLERFQLIGILRRIQNSHPAAGLPFRDWLEDIFCPDRVADLFFEPVILSAFSDQPENVSAAIAQSIFQQIFMGPKDAWHFWVPQRPLREIFDTNLTPFLEQAGIRIHRQTTVLRVRPNRLSLREFDREVCETLDSTEKPTLKQTEFPTDAVILAVPWFQAGKVMPELLGHQIFNPDVFEPRTISAVHFWTDRPLFRQKNLVFPKETIQWIFRPSFAPFSGKVKELQDSEKSKTSETSENFENLKNSKTFEKSEKSGDWENQGVYHQALLSDSDRCVSMDRDALEQVVRAELQMLFPESRFLQFCVSRTPAAVFSCNCWMEHARPTALTPYQSVFLAGDWTATNLPATMEGAVRSGNLAAEETLYFLQNLRESVKKSHGRP